MSTGYNMPNAYQAVSYQYPQQYQYQYQPRYTDYGQRPSECYSTPPDGCPLSWIRPTQRWYYDSNMGTCSQFPYTCGQGFNNFDSLNHCR